MNDVVETLKLIADLVMKQEHENLDKQMTVDEQIDFVNSIRTLNTHAQHIETLVV